MNPEENNNQTDATPTTSDAPSTVPPTPAEDNLENAAPEAAPAETPAAEASNEASAEVSTEAPAETPAEAPAETPAETPAEAPTETPAPVEEESFSATPSLDQVAADLTSAAATNSLESTIANPEESPSATPEAPVSPETSEPAAEMPNLETPAPETTEATTSESSPEALNTPETSSDSSADSQAASESSDTKVESAPIDEENPLVPAEPVPGSIGSAIAYSETAPGHAIPANKQAKQFVVGSAEPVAAANETNAVSANMAGTKVKRAKDNIRLIAIIGIAVVLVAAVVIILLFVINGASSNKPANNSANNSTNKPQAVISSLTCTKEGGAEDFSSYGNAVSGKAEVIAMYSDNNLTSFGTNLNLSYNSTEDANSGLVAARKIYNQQLKAANLTSDPFDSSYDVLDSDLTVTHQADADMIDVENAAVFGLYVKRGEVEDDIDTVLDSYESEGYTCSKK